MMLYHDFVSMLIVTVVPISHFTIVGNKCILDNLCLCGRKCLVVKKLEWEIDELCGSHNTHFYHMNAVHTVLTKVPLRT